MPNCEAERQLGDLSCSLKQTPMSKAQHHLPPISIIVWTRYRPASLVRCLEALVQIDYPAYEVVVIDNASGDQATAACAARFGLRCVREERPGLDWARNRGVAE